MASWQSGHARDCKSRYPGSTPGEASITIPSMAEPDFPEHGGDLAFATRTYGEPHGGWLDLSTGVNPAPYPVPPELLTADLLHRFPGRDVLGRLEAAARMAYAVPANAHLAAVPGSELALHLLPRLAPDRPACILAPIYGGHRTAWPCATKVTSPDAIPDGAIAILANPNNPDGRILSRRTLTALARRVAWLIVDEAFADTAPETSLVPELPGNAIVLRSLGKFYGLPGLRLGFVIGAERDVATIAATMGDWAVSSPALAVGAAALGDPDWQAATRARLKSEAEALRALLAPRGLRPIGGTDLFVLVDTPDALEIHVALARRGIWTRAFAENPQWLRIGLPGAGFARLDQALTDLR